MKAVNNYFTTAAKDAQTVLPALKDAYSRLTVQYDETTHPKLRILDGLVIFSLLSFVVQIVYMIVLGTKEPLNALMAGCFCSLGQFALCASLRIQLSDTTFTSYSNKKSIIEFIVASFLLYLSAFCLIN
uniref:Dolichyl-diphosphooligosaccharide--protein glycosyltransferase subunit OST2 n=1 Tax=Strombidium inclinatum TaxID=197538 RepID=A0A7S3MSH9_9SPIT|mmetsp:Transcript_15212/g.23496  ORF Transcript_15212/g.23496 Transcript_15212/m.23496 type:complete len:129 (+) Transcript_15212:16-402(+)